MLYLYILVALVVWFFATIILFRDYNKFDDPYSRRTQRFNSITASVYGLCLSTVWFIVVPIYLFAKVAEFLATRPKKEKKNKDG